MSFCFYQGDVYYQVEKNEKEIFIFKRRLPESTKTSIRHVSDWVESKWISPPKDYTGMSRWEKESARKCDYTDNSKILKGNPKFQSSWLA